MVCRKDVMAITFWRFAENFDAWSRGAALTNT
jgi:hypothetical protein